MSETKVRESQFAPLDDLPVDNLPEPITLTAEQVAAQAEAKERDRQRKREWAAINGALRDNSIAVMRAMS
jgi:hypothetical protein